MITLAIALSLILIVKNLSINLKAIHQLVTDLIKSSILKIITVSHTQRHPIVFLSGNTILLQVEEHNPNKTDTPTRLATRRKGASLLKSRKLESCELLLRLLL